MASCHWNHIKKRGETWKRSETVSATYSVFRKQTECHIEQYDFLLQRVREMKENNWFENYVSMVDNQLLTNFRIRSEYIPQIVPTVTNSVVSGKTSQN